MIRNLAMVLAARLHTLLPNTCLLSVAIRMSIILLHLPSMMQVFMVVPLTVLPNHNTAAIDQATRHLKMDTAVIHMEET